MFLSKTIKLILTGLFISLLSACGSGGGGSPSTVANTMKTVSLAIDTSVLNSNATWSGNTSATMALVEKMDGMAGALMGMDEQATLSYMAYLTTGDLNSLKDFQPMLKNLLEVEQQIKSVIDPNLNTLMDSDPNFKTNYAEYKAYMVVIKELDAFITAHKDGSAFETDNYQWLLNDNAFDQKIATNTTDQKEKIQTKYDLADMTTENVVVTYSATERVVVKTNDTRVKSTTDLTRIEVVGTVTSTWTDTYTITTTYSSYTDDTVNYTRTDVKTTNGDGTTSTEQGTASETSRTVGTVVEHSVSDGASALTGSVLVSEVDSNDVNINTLGNSIIQQVKIVDNSLSILQTNNISALVSVEQGDFVSAVAGFKAIATLKATVDGLSTADKLTLDSMTVTVTYKSGLSETVTLTEAIDIADGMYDRYYKGYETFWQYGADNGNVDNNSTAFKELKEKVNEDTNKSDADLKTTYTRHVVSSVSNVVNTSAVVRVVISTGATETLSVTDSTVVEVTGTVTKTYKDTYTVTRTYSSYRDDTVSYTRTDVVKTYDDGTTSTTTGETETVGTSAGNIVEHGITDSNPVRTGRVLISTVDSGTGGGDDGTTYNEADLGTKTTGLSSSPDAFLTSEVYAYCGYYSGCTLNNLYAFTDENRANGSGTSYQHIEAAGINSAWARGWTGKGVNIGIIDTGVNINHDELDGQIGGVYNNESTDWNGHGSHVAGTMVAKRDGEGTVGVAFDSKLYVVRSLSLGYLDSNYWDFFKDNNVDVVNLSINSRWDSNISFNDGYTVGSDINNTQDTYQSLSLIDADKNTYKWNKTVWKNGGYVNLDQVIAKNDSGDYVYGGMTSINALKANMANSDIILVNSAGNSQKIAMAPGWYATATNDDGSLMLDGRVIIVGSYDSASGTNNSYSATAGGICWDVVNDVCQDEYTVSDFFIRAPESMTSLDNYDSQYTSMSGTSMAAPVVTGSVALLRQMWPHMTGSNTVDLILSTADKTYSGYDVGIDGQGRLDMKAATNPIGATGIPTTGRADGNTVSSNGYVAGNNNLPSSLSSLIVEIDDIAYNREWLIPLANANVPIDTAFHSYTQYAGLTSFGTSDFAVHLREENSTDSIAVTVDGTTFGYMKEEGAYLGRYFNGMFDIGGTETAFLQTGESWDYGNSRVSANLNLGYTKVATLGNSLINDSDDLMSYGWKVQNDTMLDNNWSMTSFISQPVSVFSGSMNINAPTSRSGNDVSYTNTEWSQSAKVETDIGLGFGYKQENFNWDISGVHRFDTAVGDDYNITTSFKWLF